MTKLNLLALPQELLVRILSNLDGIALARCAMTCRFIHETLKNSSILKYIIQLHFNGVTDSGSTYITQRLSYPELIKRLQRRRYEWMSPKWVVNVSLELDYDYRPFDIVGATLTRRSTSHLEITRLPTVGSHVNEITTIETALKSDSHFWAQCLTVDAAQDVIVLLEEGQEATPLPVPATETRTARVHIRTLARDDPHPLAKQTPLQFTVFPRDGDNNIYDARLEIARTTVALSYSTSDIDQKHRQLRVLVWDWTTSELIVDSSIEPCLPFEEAAFGLLDSTYCFFTSILHSGSIQLYELARSPPAIHYVATLHLPETVPHVTISRIRAQAGPVETHPLPHTLFTVNDDDRLHVFTIEYTYMDWDGPEGETISVSLFVHQRVFMKYCLQEKQHTQGQGEATALDIPWEEWGPANTRLIFPFCTNMDWLRYVHGQRAVCLNRDPFIDDSATILHPTKWITILDFSPATVLTARGILPMPPSRSGFERGTAALLRPSKISHWQVRLYKDDVETRLPCVPFSARLARTYKSFAIYADGVVGINVDGDTETLLLDVYTV